MNVQVLGFMVLLAIAMMDLFAIVLVFLQGRYLAKMNETMTADDRIMILQNRRIEDAVKVIRDELQRAG